MRLLTTSKKISRAREIPQKSAHVTEIQAQGSNSCTVWAPEHQGVNLVSSSIA